MDHFRCLNNLKVMIQHITRSMREGSNSSWNGRVR
jgi:hypothetical protein